MQLNLDFFIFRIAGLPVVFTNTKSASPKRGVCTKFVYFIYTIHTCVWTFIILVNYFVVNCWTHSLHQLTFAMCREVWRHMCFLHTYPSAPTVVSWSWFSNCSILKYNQIQHFSLKNLNGDLNFSKWGPNGDLILSEMGTFGNRNGDQKARKCDMSDFATNGDQCGSSAWVTAWLCYA